MRWDPRTLYDKMFEEPAECDRFLSHVCTMEWHVAHDLSVTFAENRARLLPNFPEYEAEIRAWEERWWDMFSGTFAETEAAIEALHTRGIPQFALSNMSHEVFDGVVAMSPVFKRLGGFVISAEIATIKPNPAIYALACERFGHALRDFLFVDDSAWNIAGAAALGFDTHHFTNPAALRPALEARGLL